MPCYLQTVVRLTEKWKVRADILEKAIPDFVSQLKEAYGVSADVWVYGDLLVIKYLGQQLRINLGSNKLIFEKGQEKIKNMLKRAYSTTAVKTAAAKPSIQRKFQLKQTGANSFVMNRRTR